MQRYYNGHSLVDIIMVVHGIHYCIMVLAGPTQACLEEKKGRKKAQNNSLNDFIGGGGGKPKIVIPIGKKRPLGKWSSEWVTEMGIIVFQNIQLTKHYWKDLTYEDKIPLYNKVTVSL